jgi:5-methylcytosine-specific restriction endonuclease McrA
MGHLWNKYEFGHGWPEDRNRFNQNIGKRKKRSKPRPQRAKIYKSSGGICEYCLCPIGLEEATVDHVIPKSRGGADHVYNLALACYDCNQAKGDLTVLEFVYLNQVELG